MSKSKADLFRNRTVLTQEAGRTAMFGSTDDTEYLMLDLDQVHPNPDQPRKHFDEDSLRELADSIVNRGILQPILVRETQRDSFEIIAGERRWRASRIAGKAQIPALVVKTDDAALLSVLENLQREDLDAVDSARALETLIQSYNATHEALGRLIGKSQTYVTRTLRVLDLNETILAEYPDNRHVPATMLAELASVANPAEQLRLWGKAKAGLSVAGVRQEKQGRVAPATDTLTKVSKTSKRFAKDIAALRKEGVSLGGDQRKALVQLREEIDALLGNAPCNVA
jgi:ParB family chromosome partitioning protein